MSGIKKQFKLVVAAVLMIAAIDAHAMTADEAKMVSDAAMRGSASSQVLLAVMYRHGDGGYAKDDRQAAYWFEQAAQQGNPYAQMALGDLYEQGEGVAKNLKLAADWREKAAKRGNVQAQLKLGQMYLAGVGVDKDLNKAEYWLKRAAIEGNSEAQFELGKLYRTENWPKHDPDLGNSWLAKSAAQGYEGAVEFVHFFEHVGLQIKEDLSQRAPQLHKLAADGDAEAQYQLAMRYEHGIGEKEDSAQAMYWFKQAANQGHVMAIKSLIHIYQQGLDGNAVSLVQAQYWQNRLDNRKSSQ
ncbi:MAG: tetratricopeptide repeat protein [Sulfuriferula sp.]|nr:tetratricopeptide repeat protein [Sulfuriferula sp.]